MQNDINQKKYIEKSIQSNIKLQNFKIARQEQLNQDAITRKINIENILQETQIRGLK